MKVGSLDGKRRHCPDHQVELDSHQDMSDGVSSNDAVFVHCPEFRGQMKDILDGQTWFC